MSVWNAAHHLKYGDERTRPTADDDHPAAQVADRASSIRITAMKT